MNSSHNPIINHSAMNTSAHMVLDCSQVFNAKKNMDGLKKKYTGKFNHDKAVELQRAQAEVREQVRIAREFMRRANMAVELEI